ncbi:MAG: hypothetical protein ABIH59_02660 [archaeon]
MVSNWLLRQREYWVYDRLKKEFSDKEIEKLRITLTDNSFSYMKDKNKREFEGRTIKYPNLLFIILNSIKGHFTNSKIITFKRSSAKSMDRMMILPSISNKEHYVYHLKINVK